MFEEQEPEEKVSLGKAVRHVALAIRYANKFNTFSSEFAAKPAVQERVANLTTLKDVQELEQDQLRYAVVECLKRYGADKKLPKKRHHVANVNLALDAIEPEDSAIQVLIDLNEQLSVSTKEVTKFGAIGTITAVLEQAVGSVNNRHSLENMFGLGDNPSVRIVQTEEAFKDYPKHVKKLKQEQRKLHKLHKQQVKEEKAERRALRKGGGDML